MQPSVQQQHKFKVSSGASSLLFFFLWIVPLTSLRPVWRLKWAIFSSNCGSVQLQPVLSMLNWNQSSHTALLPHFTLIETEARRRSGTRMASALVRASDWVSPSAPAHIFCVTAVCSAKSRNSSTFDCTAALWVSAGWPREPPTPGGGLVVACPAHHSAPPHPLRKAERVALCWAGPLEVSSHSSLPVSLYLQHIHHSCSCPEQS